MLEEYYKVRGWDQRTGMPTRRALEKVGLNTIADELEKMGRLGKEE